MVVRLVLMGRDFSNPVGEFVLAIVMCMRTGAPGEAGGTVEGQGMMEIWAEWGRLESEKGERMVRGMGGGRA